MFKLSQAQTHHLDLVEEEEKEEKSDIKRRKKCLKKVQQVVQK